MADAAFRAWARDKVNLADIRMSRTTERWAAALRCVQITRISARTSGTVGPQWTAHNGGSGATAPQRPQLPTVTSAAAVQPKRRSDPLGSEHQPSRMPGTRVAWRSYGRRRM